MHARRHRKTSPEPTEREGGNTGNNNSSTTLIPTGDSSKVDKKPTPSGGLRSYFATARRRWSSSRPPLEAVDSSTLLPTTYSSAKSPRRPKPTAKNCNNFLMGGHYYPGKDKKRRTMRRRTLWYKIFCSSPPRKLFSWFCVLYIIVWHVLSPVTDLLFDMARSVTVRRPSLQNPMGDWLQYDSNLKVPSIEEERSEVIHSVSMRARIRFGRERRHDAYLKILEEIVPTWYHRNDPIDTKASQKGKNNNQRHNDKSKKQSSKEQKKETDKQGGVVEKPVEAKEPRSGSVATNEGGSAKEVSDNSLPFRTLATMDSVAAEYTACPKALSESDIKTTLVIQTSIERLWILGETCKRWSDPIIVVVFVPNDINETQKKVLDEFSGSVCSQIRILKYLGSEEESKPGRYPVNRLRNAGLDAVQTSHIIVTDIDFIPSQDLDKTIQSTLMKFPGDALGSRPALIVPAFERKPPEPCESETACSKYLKEDSTFIPSTFDEMHRCFEKQDCIVFQSDVNWEGHFSTNSKQWLEKKWYIDDKETQLRSLECFHTARYEPYVVIQWCPQSSSSSPVPLAPHYDERFYGYGKNKIEYVSHLRSFGYHFSILPEGFITHNPHPESEVKEIWNNGKENDLHSSMDKLYPDFLKELEIKYKKHAESIVKICPRPTKP